MTDDERRATAVGMYLYSRFATAALGLIAIAIATRVYDPRELAYVATILLLYESATSIGALGLPDAVIFFIGRDRPRAAIAVRQTTALLAAIAVPGIAITIAAGAALSKPEVELESALPFLAITLACAMPSQSAIHQLLAVGHVRAASLLQALFAMLEAIAVVAPMAIGDPAWTPPLLAVAAAVRLTVHLYLLRVVFPLARGTRWLARAELRAQIAFAAPAGFAALCGRVNVQIDKYVVNVLLSTRVFAFYTAASWELPLVTIIPYGVGAVMQVRYVELFATRRLPELRRLWFTNVLKTSLVVFPLSVFVIAAAPEIIELVFGAAYLPAVLPFQLFSAVLLHRVASYGPMLQATNQTRALLAASAVLVGTNALLTVPLTLVLGYPGAALATLLASIPAWLWMLSRIARAFGVRLRAVMPWRQLARNLAVTGALGLALALALPHLPWSVAPRLGIAFVIFMGAYVVATRALGIVALADVAYVVRWLTLRMR